MLATTVILSGASYRSAPRLAMFANEATARVRALPTVTAATVAYDQALEVTWYQTFLVEGRPRERPEATPQGSFRPVGPDYFRTMGIPLHRGREFTEHDRSGSGGVVVINQALAERYFPGQNPLGQRLRIGAAQMMWGPDMPAVFEVIGLVGNVKFGGLAAPSEPAFYVPFAQSPYPRVYLVLRTSVPPSRLVPLVREVVRSLDPNVPIAASATLSELYQQSMAARRFTMVLLAAFGGVGLLIAAAGVFGVVSYTVAQRTGEMGIRLALGAPPRSLRRAVVRQGMWVVAVGLIVGAAGAVARVRLLESLLFGVAATDLGVFASVLLALALVAWTASHLPARRAARVDPIRALRAD